MKKTVALILILILSIMLINTHVLAAFDNLPNYAQKTTYYMLLLDPDFEPVLYHVNKHPTYRRDNGDFFDKAIYTFYTSGGTVICDDKNLNILEIRLGVDIVPSFVEKHQYELQRQKNQMVVAVTYTEGLKIEAAKDFVNKLLEEGYKKYDELNNYEPVNVYKSKKWSYDFYNGLTPKDSDYERLLLVITPIDN